MVTTKRVIVTPSANIEPHTQIVLNRVKSLNPNIQIVHSNLEQPQFPSQLTSVQKYWYSKESLVFTTRKGPFCTIFPAPGDVVENIGTLLVLAWHCESTCDFCYLQNSQVIQRRWKEIYLNLDDLQKQIEIEVYLYRSVLTLWSALSFYKKQANYKIPKGFKKEADRIRGHFIKKDINSDSKAIQYLEDNLEKSFKKLGIKVDGRKLPKIRRSLPDYYHKNKKFRPRLNISEYTDIIAVDPITGFMDYLMQLLPNNPEVDLNLRTKSAHVDEMLKYSGGNQVRFAMNFNTQHAIDNWESGTASLNERIIAAKKVQDTPGYRLKVIIEPIIYYDGCEDEYAALTQRMMAELDPQNFEDISFATARYNKQLINRIKRNYPSTTLFDHTNMLIEPTKPDTKIRYEFNWRVGLFKRLKGIAEKYSDARIRLGGDKADVWDAVGLDKTAHIEDSVYQYPG